MEVEPSKLFDKHVTGLFKACNHLLQQRGDRENRAKLRNCGKRYNKDKADFVAQFLAIFNDYKVDITTGRETDEWLTEETIYLPYNKKDVKTTVKFNLSFVYKLVATGSDQQLAIQYHLYIIFSEIVTDEDDRKTLREICEQLEIALGLDNISDTESSEEGDTSGPPDILAGMDIESIGSTAGTLVSKIIGSLSEMGLDMPEGTTLPPADEIQRVINSVTSNPSSKEVIRKIVQNVQSGASIEGVIDDPQVKSLLKETLQETAKMASESTARMAARSDEGSSGIEISPVDPSGPPDFDPEEQT